MLRHGRRGHGRRRGGSPVRFDLAATHAERHTFPSPSTPPSPAPGRTTSTTTLPPPPLASPRPPSFKVYSVNSSCYSSLFQSSPVLSLSAASSSLSLFSGCLSLRVCSSSLGWKLPLRLGEGVLTKTDSRHSLPCRCKNTEVRTRDCTRGEWREVIK